MHDQTTQQISQAQPTHDGGVLAFPYDTITMELERASMAPVARVVPAGDLLAQLHAQVAAVRSIAQPEWYADRLPWAVPADADAPFRPELLELLRRQARQQLLVLHLSEEVDAAQLLAGLARVIQSHAAIIGLPERPVHFFLPVLRSEERQQPGSQLSTYLDELAPAIVLLVEADRYLLGDQLDQLAILARSQQVTLLAATTESAADWHLNPAEQVYFQDLSAMPVHDLRGLRQVLGEALQQRGLPPLDTNLGVVGIAPDSLGQALLPLATPWRVRLAVQQYDPAQRGLEAHLRETAQAALPDQIAAWYQCLAQRDQLLVLALALLADLPPVLFMTLLEELYEQVWDLRGPGQPMLDSGDYRRLEAVFQVNQRSSSIRAITSAHHDIRLLLLRLAVPSYQRHLLYAQLWLAGLVSRSHEYGDAHQRARLRSAACDALADLALVDAEFAQPGLMLLVADQHDASHHGLAGALGSWPVRGYTANLHALLQRWPASQRSQRLVQVLQRQTAAEEPEAASQRLQALVVLTLGYAMRHGGLPAPLASAFAQLARGQLSQRQWRYLQHECVPQIIQNALPAYATLVCEWATTPVSREQVQDALIRSYHSGSPHTEQVWAVLNGWGNKLLAAPVPAHSQPEALLTFVATTLAELRYPDDGPLVQADARQLALALLDVAPTPAARTQIRPAVLRLAGGDSGVIQDVIASTDLAEEDSLRDALLEHCSYEREAYKLASPNHFDPRWYWDDGSYKTSVEQALMDWLMIDSRYTMQPEQLRQLALRLLVGISTQLDTQSNRRPTTFRTAQQRLAEPQTDRQMTETLIERRYGQFVAQAVSGILNQAIALEASMPAAMELLLRRWHQEQGLAELAQGLAFALARERHPESPLGRVPLMEGLRARMQILVSGTPRQPG